MGPGAAGGHGPRAAGAWPPGAAGRASTCATATTALLFEAGDADGLAGAVQRLAGDPGLRARLRDGGLATAERHTAPRFEARVVSVLEEVAGGSRASVVIPAHNAADALPSLLRSLEAQTLCRDAFEVVVVDNASTDDTAAVAASGGARVVSEPRPSRARARNAGVGAALADRIAFVDAECEADPGWLEALLRCLDRSPVVAGPVRLRLPAAPECARALRRPLALPPARARRARRLGRVGQPGCHARGLRRRRRLRPLLPPDRRGRRPVPARRRGRLPDRVLRRRVDLAPGRGLARGHAAARLPPGLVDGPAPAPPSRPDRRPARPPPGPLVRGDWALRRFGIDPDALAADERRRMMLLARAEYAARMVGAAHAELSPRRAR